VRRPGRSLVAQGQSGNAGQPAAVSRLLDQKNLEGPRLMQRNVALPMTIETARRHVLVCREAMDTLYQKPVFDEWVIVAFGSKGPAVLAYEGPRADSFARTLHADSAPLAREMADRDYAVGDFEFAQEAKGARFDCCVRVGPASYLFCNNTYGTLGDLRQDPRWLRAQKPLLELTEKFRADPLV
jgi:hypothetical protein